MISATVIFALTSVLSVVSAQEISEGSMQALMNYHKDCKAETNINDGLASGLLTGNFPDDPVLKQHMFCMSKKLGIQNDAGEIQKDGVRAKIGKVINDEAKIEELTESCSVEKDSPEETAFEMAKCVYKGTHP